MHTDREALHSTNNGKSTVGLLKSQKWPRNYLYRHKPKLACAHGVQLSIYGALNGGRCKMLEDSGIPAKTKLNEALLALKIPNSVHHCLKWGNCD